uniref:Uncharacterized protein n=1 Tax=Panagrolaimus sp. ES5 TaxID=591445 RepID=A0AC34FQX8_9BILA
MEIGRHLFALSSILVLFLTTFPCFIEAYACEYFKTCAPIADWEMNANETGATSPRSCDGNACASWFCVVNGAVIYGGGCYSDFKTICTGSTEKTTVFLNSIRFGTSDLKSESGNYVFVCKSRESNCNTHEMEWKKRSNDQKPWFKDLFLHGATSNPNGCLSGASPNKAVAEPLNSGLMNQMNGFKLFGMILLGIIFTKLCASSSTLLSGSACTRSEMIIEKSIKARFYASYRHQEFSLPDSSMHYIAMNPTNAKLYEKLIQSCKFFFVKNPILVLSNLYYDSRRWIASNDGGWKFMTLGNVTSKIWITEYVDLNPVNAEDKSVTSIFPKLYQCDATMLNITNLNIYYDDLMFFGTTVDSLDLCQVTVKYKNGKNMAFEKIVELFPKLVYLNYISPSDGSAMTSKTFNELLKNPQFLKLKRCTLLDTPEDFDIEAFYKYMKKNKHTSIRIHFCDTISEAYRNRLQDIVNEIVESETHEYKPPFIGFLGYDEKMCDKLRNCMIDIYNYFFFFKCKLQKAVNS